MSGSLPKARAIKEIFRALVVLAFVGTIFGTHVSLSWADCPDYMNCYGPVPGYETFQWVGSIGQGSCYSWAHAKCAPWFCKNNYTTQEYWDNKCNQTFGQCKGRCRGKWEVVWEISW
jgi:hypothetical protein